MSTYERFCVGMGVGTHGFGHGSVCTAVLSVGVFMLSTDNFHPGELQLSHRIIITLDRVMSLDD